MLKTAAILSTGDELTTGRTVDTNAAFIADRLHGAGLDVVAVFVVGDDHDRIEWAWKSALDKADLVVSTGGLGPTADDLTTETVGRVTGRRLVRDQDSADRIRKMFEAIGRHMPENNLKQADFPEGATIVPNALGTAPGFRLAVEAGGRTRHCVVLPGVPREMKPMIEEQVLPWIESGRGGAEVYRSHTFQTFGISESALDELVAGALDPATARLAFRAAFPQISLRVTVQGAAGDVDARLRDAVAGLRERVAPYCYGEGDTTTMEGVVGALLTKSGHTLAVAESCTGGLIGHRLTDVPGSSAYVLADVVAYSNAVKIGLLGVSAQSLERHGAVSDAVALEMAEGVRRVAGATIGLATTGIAGPTGGTPDKPVGTVHVAIATAERRAAQRYQLWGTREWVKLLTSQIALDWIRRLELGQDPALSALLRR